MATLKTKERQSANLEWAGDTIRACARVRAPCCQRREGDAALQSSRRLALSLVSVIACRNYTRQRMYHTPTRTYCYLTQNL